MSDIVISVHQLSKKFCRNLRRSMWYGIEDLSKSFLGITQHVGQLRKDEFWALHNINFKLHKGEALGIMGVNGSGKSTLLRLLTGIFPPDTGEIRIKGRIGALIAVGAGFHPHMTGRENIYLNGTILGMARKEIDKKFDQIVEFAEIGDFLDAPVSTYSSGMHVRLGFAIAVSSEPEILLADEVLAVGDYNFQMKCYDKIYTLINNASVILVSHNEIAIRSVCQRVMILDKGHIAAIGETDEMIQYYRNMLAQKRTFHLWTKEEENLFHDIYLKKVSVKDIEIYDQEGHLIRKNKEALRSIAYANENEICVKVKLFVKEEIEDCRFALYLRDLSRMELIYPCAISLGRDEDARLAKMSPGYKEIQVKMTINGLMSGRYTVAVAFIDRRLHNKHYGGIDVVDNLYFDIVKSPELKAQEAFLNRPYYLPRYEFDLRDL